MKKGKNLNVWPAIVMFLLLIVSTAAGRTIYVDDDGPADFNTIQAAIDDSNNGDIVIIRDGIYTGPGNRDLDFLSKAITVRSENGPENCIIDIGAGASRMDYHTGFYVHEGPIEGSIIEGFAIKGGRVYEGGAIYCYNASLTVKNCIITENTAGFGGGIYCRNSNANIYNCLIAGNKGWDVAGGIYIRDSTTTVTNCTIVENRSPYGGGGILWDSSSGDIVNCIIWGNSDEQIVRENGPDSITYSDVQDGWEGQGNIDADPCFVQPGYWDANGTPDYIWDDFWVDGDYHLLPGSPCIDTGDNTVVTVATDLDGNPRIVNGIVDMGAYEYQGPRIVYVDANASGANNGASWTDAYNYLQDALADANWGDEIWVAQGIYKPDQGSGVTTGDRTATFQLKNGVAIRGGYAGSSQPDPNARDIDKYESILSGDLNGNDVDVNDPADLLDEPTRSDNSYNVVKGRETTDGTAVLDGFTITGGNYTPISGFPFGGGGGMYNDYASSPTVSNCMFTSNSAIMYGGGMCNEGDSNPTLTNCVFSGNYAGYGGGMRNYRSSPTLANCTFKGNSAYLDGGMLNHQSSPTLTNCTFSKNSGDYGGALSNHDGSNSIVTNCILWGGTPQEIYVDHLSMPAVTYSDVRGGYPGEGNIDADPCFADANNGDYHLLPSSPCIDTGDNTVVTVATDLDGNARIVNGIVDMGAYEYQGPRTIYVDADAPGANNGSSWANAYNYLQDAFADANSNGDINEIWVAEGIYKPNQGVGITPGDRTATFQLKNGVAIKGGYAGFGEPDPNARDIDLYETILSGDLDGDDIDVNDLWDLWNEPTRAENSYHVVTGSGIDATAMLDGFTITAGNANGSYSSTNNYGGAGMYNYMGSPTVTNCKFSWNSAICDGGGMFNYSSSPIVNNCKFTGNSAGSEAPLSGGGGMYNRSGSSPKLNNCTLSGNSGGGGYGGGMYNWDSSPTLTNCTLSGNSAGQHGGGIWNRDGIGWLSPGGALIIINSILWGDTPEEIYVSDGTTVVTYCDVEGGWEGDGNIDADPCFADPNSGDYHLKSQAGRWDANEGRWTIDEVTSPCIDAGNPADPIGHEPFPNGGIINMGAYGGTAEASKSYFGEPVCQMPVAGDINGDCVVNFKDFAIMAYHWLEDNRLPGQASNPSPPNYATGVSITGTILSWGPGYGAVSHDVYFGTTSPGSFCANQTGRTFNTGPLQRGTNYYWRIDEVNPFGTTTGEVWHFTTGGGGPPPG